MDPDGRWIETFWDIGNVVMGVKRAYDNFRSGHIVSAVVDTGGAIVDLAAAVVPMVPGGVGTAIKTARAVERLDDIGDAAKGIVKQGRYEFPDLASGGAPYIGQSGNIPHRLGQHEKAG